MNYQKMITDGFDKDWVNKVKENWQCKKTGKYVMGIYLVGEIDKDPRSGELLETTYFDTSRDMDEIFRYFEGFGYVIADAKTNNTIGEGILDYISYDEMEAYTGEPWIANVHTEENLHRIPDNRKIELFDSMLGYLVQFWNTEKLIDNLYRIGFTAAELKAEDIDVDCEIAERIADFMFDSGYAEIPCYFKQAGINTKDRKAATQDILSLLSKGKTTSLKESINQMLDDWDDYLKEEHSIEGSKLIEILDTMYKPEVKQKQLQFLVQNAEKRSSSDKGKESVIQEYDK